MNTPSGTNLYPLDKFILHYAQQGYEWINRAKASYFVPYDKNSKFVKKNIEALTSCDDDIIFFKNDSILCADAIIENNRIVRYEIDKIH
jgi:hypothetical protein